MTSGTRHTRASSSPTATADRPAAAKARFWDKIARKYAADPVTDMAGYETTLARARALIAPTHRVLEIGCGTGTTALRLGPCYGHLVATDVSAEMIAIAREKLAAAPQPNLEFQVVDADALAFGQASHDVVLAFNVLHLVSDLDAALTSVENTLAPGGLFISKTPCIADMNPLLGKVLLPVMRLVGKAPPVLCFRAPDLQAALTRHGLEIVAVEYHGTKGKDLRPFIVARKRGS
ncbi:class I SAM-dependent methyltransferase [Nannocystis radixulma]|uniref:Class I SAM-dependent methyltransferase n=1 Tax=Nannocystis radixulma TaxID=2995305 RepID=A0ABT5BJP3_9BACT|nr:class I SAM-dependent methyltransferase [Nannocystis radixulma]MDC0674370.1 class I SAM-dependent methyltransferase [Nannocystis radixulma]